MMNYEELMGERARLRDRAADTLHEAAETAADGDYHNARNLALDAVADLDLAAAMHPEIRAAAVRKLEAEMTSIVIDGDGDVWTRNPDGETWRHEDAVEGYLDAWKLADIERVYEVTAPREETTK